MKIDVAQSQIRGDRDYQQDSIGHRDIADSKLLFLADGMGGYKGGEIASEIVIDTFMRYSFDDNSRDSLEEAVNLANRGIEEYKKFNPDVSSMGTTLIALLISKNSYRWVSVGDSPLYLIRDGKIKRINQNHSVAGMLYLRLARGEITQEDVDKNRNKHMLTSALLGEDISMIDVSKEYILEENDIFILASDGVETLTEDEILEIINSSEGDMNIATKRVMEEIENRSKKNQDNATIMIASQLEEMCEESFPKTVHQLPPSPIEMAKKRESESKSAWIKKVFMFLFTIGGSLFLWNYFYYG